MYMTVSLQRTLTNETFTTQVTVIRILISMLEQMYFEIFQLNEWHIACITEISTVFTVYQFMSFKVRQNGE